MPTTAYTVLVVDDSSVNRSYLHYILDEEGYRVMEAKSGETCIESVRLEKPLLILLDVVMGGIDGFETLRLLKEDPSSAHIPVIMLTSLEDQVSKLKAFELGAVDYIVKSSNPAEVKARVRVHVRLTIANRELIRSRAESVSKISAAQRSLLANPVDVPGASFAAYYRSLHEAGGDFYDVVTVAEDLHFYLIADVAGHDVGTSYITPAVKVLLKQFATPAYPVEETISCMNGVLSQTVCQETYLTAFALRINRRSMKAVFLAAGHPPALYVPASGPCRFLECKNPLVGMIEGATYRSESIDVTRGDRFILFTDGLVEVGEEPAPWVSGKEALIPVAESLRAVSLSELPEALVKAMGAWDSVDDDVAVLVVEV
ncbi:MAG: fused response regulator/phosphatase [Treponemataceae bacterium]|jgi:sigma-B regulation protein RsbU (phosphoserine phosphatase)